MLLESRAEFRQEKQRDQMISSQNKSFIKVGKALLG
jgi:hypothetical protein